MIKSELRQGAPAVLALLSQVMGSAEPAEDKIRVGLCNTQVGDGTRRLQQHICSGSHLLVHPSLPLPSPPVPSLPSPPSPPVQAMKCFVGWIQFGLPVPDIFPLIHHLFAALEDNDMCEQAVETLVEIALHPDSEK